MRSPRSLTVIGLRGGVQSSVMALMAGDGAFEAHPGLRHLRRYDVGAAQHLHAPGMDRETGSETSARVTVASERASRPLTLPRQSGIVLGRSWPGDAQTPRAVAPPERAGSAM